MISEADELFRRLDEELSHYVEGQYFQEPREFRSLIQVLQVLNEGIEKMNRGELSSKDVQSALQEQNSGQVRLHEQLEVVNKVIESVVTFQHGGLNHSVDTLSEVVKEFTKGRSEIQHLRNSLIETQSVLTAKKGGQIALRELYMKKVELKESLRMVKDLEELKNTPLKVQRLMSQKRYYSAVKSLTWAIDKSFSEDLYRVEALVYVREKLLELKEILLEGCVQELRDMVIGSAPLFQLRAEESESESDEEGLGVGVGVGEWMETSSVVSFRHMRNSSGNNTSMYGSMASHAPPPSAWSLDLGEVDEAVEGGLLDPSASPHLYIRLLVKTVQSLGCEEDVERLLLDSLLTAFRTNYYLPYRQKVGAVMSSVALPSTSSPADGAEGGAMPSATVSQAYLDYMGGLLEGIGGVMQRGGYVCKLLGVSKAGRGGTRDQQGAKGSSGNDKKGVVGASASTSTPLSARDGSVRVLEGVWEAMEKIVVADAREHCVDPDLQRICDAPSPRGGKAAPKAGGVGRRSLGGRGVLEEDDAEGDEDNAGGKLPLLFPPSPQYAGVIYKRVFYYQRLSTRIRNDLQLSPTPSLLLTYLNEYIAQELVPLYLSQGNGILRTLTSQPSLYTLPLSIRGGGGTLPQPSDLLAFSPTSSPLDLMFSPLEGWCRGWGDLPTHRGGVAGVVDRVLRGWAGAARGAGEEVLWGSGGGGGLLTWGGVKGSVAYMRNDVLYGMYRSRVGGGGGGADGGFMTFQAIPPVEGGIAELEDGAVGLEEKLLASVYRKEAGSMWSGRYVDFTSRDYVLTNKDVMPASTMNTLATISYLCDTLARKTITMVNQTTRGAAAGRGSSEKTGDGGVESTPKYLATTVRDALKDVQKVSDECVCMLRAEGVKLTLLMCHSLSLTLLATLANPSSTPSSVASPATTMASPTATPTTAARALLAEEEVIAGYVKELAAKMGAVSPTLYPFALPLVLTPLCYLLPRYVTYTLTTTYTYALSHGAPPTLLSPQQVKSRCVRVMVHAQNCLWGMLTSSTFAPTLALPELAEIRRAMGDLLIGGVEAGRRLVQMVGSSKEDVKAFLGKQEEGIYTNEDFKFLASFAGH